MFSHQSLVSQGHVSRRCPPDTRHSEAASVGGTERLASALCLQSCFVGGETERVRCFGTLSATQDPELRSSGPENLWAFLNPGLIM